MLEIGIFAKTFVRPTLEDVLDAVAAQRLRVVQFNLSCAGLPTLPGAIPDEACERIRRAHEARGIRMAAISGTVNLIHPDPETRRDGLHRLGVLMRACRALGTGIVTLCSGTRDPVDMWRRHPENDTPEAWADLLVSMAEVAAMAEEAGIVAAFEPEISNVVDSARKARRLLDEIASPHLRVVMDASNLFHAGELPRMREILDEAFDRLGPEIVLVHAKDLSRDGAAGHEAAGTGVLDYDHLLARLRGCGYDGPLILHGLSEAQVPAAVAFLRGSAG